MYATTSCSLPFGHKQEVKLYLEKSGFDSFQPQAVLFDMDGVLYDSMPNHARCWQEAMAKFGLMYDEKARLFGLLPKAPIMEAVL